MTGIVALIIGIVVTILLLKLAFKLLGVVIGIGAALLVYLLAEKLIGKGR